MKKWQEPKMSVLGAENTEQTAWGSYDDGGTKNHHMGNQINPPTPKKS